MNRKLYILLAGLAALSLLLAACRGGGAQTGGTPQTVEVTRIVEVTREVAVAGTPETTEVQVPVTFAEAGDTLKTVQDRGTLLCGGNANVPGFGYLDPDTQQFAGFDIDFCKAIAAAVFDDPEKIQVVPTTGTTRFPALQSGEVDVLIRNTTWTISRDTSLGFDFGPTTFYDGQGMMVRQDSGITDLEGLAGGTVCVQQGTTTEKNLADVMRALNVDYEPLVLADAVATREAYDEGRCDGFTTDKSGLVSQQILLQDPAAHVILDVTMSKEPLGPLVRHGDNNWGDVVTWVVYCTIAAEELGIDSTNVDDMLGSDDPVILNTLGVEGDLGLALGLTADFCVRVIRHVGNYAEIYDRNLGPDTPFNLPRGLNALYTQGGLQYAPPFR
ncbi:MAG: amino acid ABC transporter substrate-binding protein [Anaerolineales bacterium]